MPVRLTTVVLVQLLFVRMLKRCIGIIRWRVFYLLVCEIDVDLGSGQLTSCTQWGETITSRPNQ